MGIHYKPIKRMGDVTLSRIERHFFTCNKCEKMLTADFTFEMFPCEGAKGMIIEYCEYRAEDGSLNYVATIEACPYCGSKSFKHRQLKTHKHSTKHVCGDKCKNAVSETCTCSCDGTNHGINHKKENGALTLF
jgi:hypothetical protein